MISIIIPCYNCEKTIKDAVESVYQQNLDNLEIIMVDDKSTDNTLSVMKEISKKYKEVKIFCNKKNLGGGSTRNYAVKKTSGEIIFCLDSDDILGDGSLKKMLDLLKEKNCDAIGIGKSIKFKGDSIKNISHVDNFNKYIGKPIPAKSLFEKDSCPLLLVCMFTKKAFNKIGGYPENHDFDTQGFGFRFLLNNLVAYTCVDATYYHRINFNKSYYLREYESGKVNHNMYHVLEEFLYMFNDDAKKMILEFNLNNPSRLLFKEIEKKDNVLIENFNKIKPDIKNLYDKYWIALNHYNNKEYMIAQKIFDQLIIEIPKNYYLHYYLDKCYKKTSIRPKNIDYKKIKKLFSYKEQGGKVNIITRGIRKILRIIREKI